MWGRWRLVESELYDLASDPGQQRGVSAQQPEIVAKLRKAHAQWWKDVEPWTTKRSAIIVGDDHENPSTLVPSTQHEQKRLSPEMAHKILPEKPLQRKRRALRRMARGKNVRLKCHMGCNLDDRLRLADLGLRKKNTP
jgi:hypothetical protein